MTRNKIGLAALLTFAAIGTAAAQPAAMTFFVTSTGVGKGADFGGLAGADKYCQTLAATVGAARRQDVARLPEHAGCRRRERQGPHRQRPVAERQGRRRRQERRANCTAPTTSPSRRR